MKTTTEPQENELNYCALPLMPQRKFDESISNERLSAIMLIGLKWVNGTELKYYFFQNENPAWKGTPQQEQVVRNAFGIWKSIGIGVNFKEVTSPMDADIRIGFLRGNGSWSYVGRDIWDIAKDQRTMNFGWDLTRSPKEIDTAIHEIGHTLGFQHEHQNPDGGIVWDEEVVYTTLAGSPNYWDRKTTYDNIIRKLDPNEVNGTTWDPNSVMHYPFSARMIKAPAPYQNGLQPAGGLSAKDKQAILSFYPGLTAASYTTLTVAQSFQIHAENGDQEDFVFIPDHSRKYKIQTLGEMDTVLVLFEEENGEMHYLAGDDDSGKNSNACISHRLIKGRKYIIRNRILYRKTGMTGGIAIS